MCSLVALASWPSRGRSSAGAAASDLQQRRHEAALPRQIFVAEGAEVGLRAGAGEILLELLAERFEGSDRIRHPPQACADLAGAGVGVGGGLRQLRERGRARDGEIGELLAVDRIAGGLQARDQLAVGDPVLARGGVDAHHPEPAEIALLAAPADERVLERGVDRLFRGAIELALGLVEPFRPGEQLLPLRAPDVSSFYSRHRVL